MQKLRCNCPDAIAARAKIPGANIFSLQFDSDWSKGFNGIRNNGGNCQHELAVMRIREEIDVYYPQGIPNDVPVPGFQLTNTKKEFTIPEIPRIPRIK